MSMRSVARQYANALFAVVEKTGRVDEVGRDVASFAALVEEHPDLRTALESPAVSVKKKRAAVDALLERNELAVEVRRLLELLADGDRLALIADIAHAYRERAMEASGVITAELVTALPVGDARHAALANALGRATGRRVELSGRVDPAIVGGAVARVGSVVYDGSVARQLERMRQRLSTDV